VESLPRQAGLPRLLLGGRLFFPTSETGSVSTMTQTYTWMRALWALTLSFSVMGCGPAAISNDEEARTVTAVSLISLIANPTPYHDQTIGVIGVARFDLEGTVLYLHQEDYANRIATNAIWLEFRGEPKLRDIQSLTGKYVVVKGRFDKSDKGFRQQYAGAVYVTTITLLPEPFR
jgi:hypothetical protein